MPRGVEVIAEVVDHGPAGAKLLEEEVPWPPISAGKDEGIDDLWRGGQYHRTHFIASIDAPGSSETNRPTHLRINLIIRAMARKVIVSAAVAGIGRARAVLEAAPRRLTDHVQPFLRREAGEFVGTVGGGVGVGGRDVVAEVAGEAGWCLRGNGCHEGCPEEEVLHFGGGETMGWLGR